MMVKFYVNWITRFFFTLPSRIQDRYSWNLAPKAKFNLHLTDVQMKMRV